MATYYKTERDCSECGERFWGTAGANFCSSACRSRSWRSLRARGRWQGLAALCEDVVRRRSAGKQSVSKLLVRLLRATAAELRARGWDPVEVLAGAPEDPVAADNMAAGAIEGTSPHRVKRLHSPALELELIEEALERGVRSEGSRAWHEARRTELEQQIAGVTEKPGK